MRKIKYTLLLLTAWLLVVTLPTIQTVFAEDSITVLVNGNPVETSYSEGVTVSLSATGNPKIQYMYMSSDASYTSPYYEYSGPFEFSRRGDYIFTVRTRDENNVLLEEVRFVLRMAIPFDESYTKIVRNNENLRYKTDGKEIILRTYSEKSKEVRAIWVATVSNIDVPVYQNDEQYKAYLIDILDTVKAHNMNTVFFQVRSMNDAFYPSALAPYSRYIKGVLGEGLDWDILEFMVEEAHKRGLELHAWLNPYRIANAQSGTLEEKLSLLHEDNFARKNPHLVMEDNGGAMILNPGEPAVRQYIYDVIEELMENYNIDGIHMDDYFYTYDGHTAAHDATAFANHNPDNLTLADWRRSNVDVLVKEIYEQVEQFNAQNNRNLKWGISPIGIWRSIEDDPNGSYTGRNAASSYRDQYADTRKWVKEGWLHYINPQVYWELSREIAPYADIVRWWNDVASGTNVKVLVGQGFYRMIETNTSMNHSNEMIDQIRVNRLYPNVIGTAFFSYRTLKSNRYEVTSTLERLEETYWTKEVGWPWPTDVQEPDTDEQLIAKAGLQAVIDEVDPFVLGITSTTQTNPYKLSEGLKYALDSDYDTILEALNKAKTTISTLELTVAQIESEQTALSAAYAVFQEKIITGLGEFETEEFINKYNELVSFLEDLKTLRSQVTPTDKSKEELELGIQYVGMDLIAEVDDFIDEVEALFTEPYIKEVDLNTFRASVPLMKNKLSNGIFYGTNQVVIDEKTKEIEDFIKELEAYLDDLSVTSVTNKAELDKDKTYITLQDLNEINAQIALAKSFLKGEFSEEELDELLSNLHTLETNIATKVIVGEKEEKESSSKAWIFFVIGGVLVLGGASIGAVLFMKKKAS